MESAENVTLVGGSFGIAKLQAYRGIYVAVKELLPRSLKDDVRHEAEILSIHFYHVCLVFVQPPTPSKLSCNIMAF